SIGADRRRVRAREDLHGDRVVVPRVVDAAHFEDDRHRPVADRAVDDAVDDLARLEAADAADRPPELIVEAGLAGRAGEIVVRALARGGRRLRGGDAVEVEAVEDADAVESAEAGIARRAGVEA